MDPAAAPLPLTDWAALPAHCDAVVIGAGAGGAVTAATLTEGGRSVTLLEEGGQYVQQRYPPFGMQEMIAAYRRRGMTVALGKAAVNYVEARCIGGGSEINSGLYHRPPPAALRRWAAGGAAGADSAEIAAACAENEKDLGICKMPGAAPPASARLAAGASALGWRCEEVPRWHRYDSDFRPEAPGGARQSMSRTFLPRFIAAGGRLVQNCEVRALQQTADGWRIEAACGGMPAFLQAAEVFVAAGAARSPWLLRKSGYKRRIGQTLRMHVFVRVIAEFDDIVNGEAAGIGPHQIDEFAPRLRLGCGVSSKAHLAAALAQSGARDWLQTHDDRWRHRAAYYAAIGGGIGQVRNIGGSEAVFYRLGNEDYYHLADGLRLLSRLLFRAGARQALPVLNDAPVLRGEHDLWRLPRPLPPARACLTSVHLMGSCPMGTAGAADAFGAVHGARGLYLADASLFYDSPNVNPQGAVMAFARRNALHYLSST